MKKVFMFLWVYIYPFPAYIFFYNYWSELISKEFALYMLIVPTLYGYIIPGIAVNYMKKWKFHTKFRLGGYYLHHGFKYASNMNTWFFLASFHVDILSVTPIQALTLCISTGCIHAFIIWWHDTNLVKSGKLELKNVLVNDSMSAEEKVFTYAPLTFFILGSSYAFSAVWGAQYFKHNDISTQALTVFIILAYTFIATTSSVAFGALEFVARRKLKTDL